MRAFALCITAFLLTGCGQKGALYLPERARTVVPSTEPAGATPPAATAPDSLSPVLPAVPLAPSSPVAPVTPAAPGSKPGPPGTNPTDRDKDKPAQMP